MKTKKAVSEVERRETAVQKEVKNLLEMFEFFLTERRLGKPISALGEAVRDMRLIIGRLLVDHFLGLSLDEEEKFCTDLADMLAERAACQKLARAEDRKYFDYCIGEVITCFEYAREIKAVHSDDLVLQKILSLDIPILRPFNYGLQGNLKLLKGEKFRRRHNL